MSKTITAIEAVERVEMAAADAWARRVAGELTVIDATSAKIGQGVRQGDVYLMRVDDSHPRGKKINNRQLAPGSTQGSRHVAEDPFEVYEGAKLPDWCNETALLGPVIVARGGSALVSHPEHTYSEHAAGTTWQCLYQMDGLTRQRAMD